MKTIPVFSRQPLALLILLAGLVLTGCSFFEVKNTTSRPVRVLLELGTGLNESAIVGPGDSWITTSEQTVAYGATIKDAKAYREKYDRMNGEFEAIKSNKGISAAEREAQMKDFMLRVSDEFRQVPTLFQCGGFTCEFCAVTIVVNADSLECSTDDSFIDAVTAGDPSYNP